MAASKLIVPPGGFMGASQQSQAVQQMIARQSKTPTTRRKARKKVAKKRPVKRRVTRKTTARKATRRSKKPARLVKGSAAAKRHMAKLRRMRKG